MSPEQQRTGRGSATVTFPTPNPADQPTAALVLLKEALKSDSTKEALKSDPTQASEVLQAVYDLAPPEVQGHFKKSLLAEEKPIAPEGTTGLIPGPPGLDQLHSPKRETVADALAASQERILVRLNQTLAEAMPLAQEDDGLAAKVTELLDGASSIIRGDLNRTLGKKEAAEILELSEVRVLQLAQKGRIGKKIAGQYRFSQEELEAFKRQDRKTGVHLDVANSKKERPAP